jgi:hypothetical protein
VGRFRIRGPSRGPQGVRPYARDFLHRRATTPGLRATNRGSPAGARGSLVVASRTGDDTLLKAFPVYVQFRGLIETHYRPLADCEAILDFGCGWGRITLFFIKNLAPARL